MRKRKNIQIYMPIFLALMLVTGIFIGKVLIPENQQSDDFYISRCKNKIDKVLSLIEHNYVDSVSKNKLEEAAIHALFDSLDPHSTYIPAEELKKINEPLKGEFSGIGIRFNMIDDTVRVIETIPNGPSEKVGIKPGDKIIKINDTTVAGINTSTNTIVSRLKGLKGTTVEVSIARRGVKKLIDFEITRDNIPLESVDVSYMINDSTGYIKLSNFSRKTPDEFFEGIKTLKDNGTQKIILDLRGNGGGYMGTSIQLADHFLKDGKLIVYTKGKYAKRKNYFATSAGMLQDTDIVILIDEFSASASEILAGAIQDNDRGTIIGRLSFGKGLVQQQIPLEDGSAIRLTVARYYTPTGRCIQKSYRNGKEDYYNELTRRYTNGEVFHPDSIHFNDSLKYITPNGDTVYGGGGIMPDIYVPKDTSNLSAYISKVIRKGLIYKFVFDYADNHRDQLNAFDNWKTLFEELDKKEILSQFYDYTANKGVKLTKEQTKEDQYELNVQLKANIIRHIYGNEGYYPAIKDIDKTLERAIIFLENKD